jgi:hypothetical protein
MLAFVCTKTPDTYLTQYIIIYVCVPPAAQQSGIVTTILLSLSSNIMTLVVCFCVLQS